VSGANGAAVAPSAFETAPFVGGKDVESTGSELGAEGVSAFTEPKHVHMDFTAAPSPEWWFPYQRPDVEGAGPTRT
jgi:hypothetical protein